MEPTISHLFKLDKQNTIREAWTVDCQNHGEAAILNEKVLVERPGVLCEYLRYWHPHFVTKLSPLSDLRLR